MAKKKAEEPVIVKTKDRRILSCQLTDEELRKASDALAKYVDDLRAIEDEKKSMAASFKSKAEACTANLNAQARLVRDKREPRPVDVEVESNYTDCTIRVVRLDTGEEVEKRKMSYDEKQRLPYTDNEEVKDESGDE